MLSKQINLTGIYFSLKAGSMANIKHISKRGRLLSKIYSFRMKMYRCVLLQIVFLPTKDQITSNYTNIFRILIVSIYYKS